MGLKKIGESARLMISALIVVCVAVVVLIFVANSSTTNASGDRPGSTAKAASPSAPSATFPGTGTGAIPDGPGAAQTPGAPLDISFAVTGISGPPSNVEVSMTATHSWVGDVKTTLIAPNGTSFVIFGYTGATTATSFGSSSDLSGAYNFKDSAAGTNWWTAAAATPVPAGNYRTTASGGAGQTNPAPVTNLTAAFSGVAAPNGTWILRTTDGGAGDTGSISAATLTIAGGAVAPVQHVGDFNGDGKTDFSVVRNTGGGPSGQVTWLTSLNGPGTYYGADWGIATDFFTPVDFDGDGKTDIAVWRSGAAGSAAFYILQSATSTFRLDVFGQTGDDPSVVGDYDGDGKADVAVYRAGATAGAQSTWYYRGSLSNPGGNISFVPWGQNGDFPAPGDYDGDGKADFVIQRNNGGGQAAFWRNRTTAGVDVIVYGTPTDVIVPGDYDGDGKTDIAVIRGIGGAINWFVIPSSTGVVSGAPYAVFGASATDFPTQGDFDGDGKTDVGIWRPSATAGLSAFWYNGSTSGVAAVQFGANGDYPTGNYNSH
jgi:subtilisin-like proprotein convertase family protein